MPAIYLQSLVIAGSNPAVPPGDSPNKALLPSDVGNYPISRTFSSAFDLTPAAAPSESRLLKMSVSSVPIISHLELMQEYHELGETLSEMTTLDEGDEWQLEAPVFNVACYVAAELMTNAFPAPQLFNHGPKSVVFNWSRGLDNLYLTVSSDRLSALISSPERIKRRVEYSLNELLSAGRIFGAIQSVYLDQQVIVTVSGASDRSEILS